MGNHILFLVLLSFLSIPVYAYTQSNEVQHMSIILSNKGIDFAKDELIKKAASTMIPLELPDIEKSKKIPLIGRVRFVLSDITVDRVDIESSHVETGEKGLVLVVSGATAYLTMNWGYSYKNWVIVISDSGEASVQVEGMQIQLSIALQEQGGNIKATLLDCTCHVDDISIKVDGGASWLYQALVDVFEGSISTAIEQAITKKLEEGIEKLDSVLQSLPKQLPVDDIATLDITFVENPLLSNSALEFDVDGLFKATADNSLLSNIYYKQTQTSFSCNDPAKMIEISVPEYTFNSAASVYYNAGCMHWMINKLPDQSVLNTASWRYVYPGLYEKYPDDALKLNISVTTPPIIRIMKHGINADIYLDAIVNVLDAGSVIPVACVSLVLSTSGSPHVLRYNLAGTINLEGFTMSLKWSVIGDVNMPLLRPIMLVILKAVYVPYVNIHLMKGFPLPLPHVVLLKNPEIYYSNSKMIICSNMVTS